MNLERAAEGVVAFAVVEAAGYAVNGVQGLSTALPIAIATGGLVYKTGISETMLEDIASILEGNTPPQSGSSSTPTSTSTGTGSSSTTLSSPPVLPWAAFTQSSPPVLPWAAFEALNGVAESGTENTVYATSTSSTGVLWYAVIDDTGHIVLTTISPT